MNPHLQAFLAGLDERFPDDSTSMSMSDYIVANTRLRQRQFSFKGFEFQRQIVDDMHRDLSCIKLSQIGLTEVQMRKFFGFLKRNVGTSGIFSLPTQPMRDKLSQTRIKTLIENEPIFNGPMVAKPVRQKALYQVDESFGYITGTTEGEATSISADILMEDEVDLADQQMRSLFQSRLQGSQWKITQRFSTPTYLGYGIDAAYQASDKHEWQIRCPCGHWQVPIFHARFMCLPGLKGDHEDLSKLGQDEIDAINLDDAYVRCEKCSRPLDLENGQRQWVAEFPSRRARGYRVRPFSISTITIPYIFEQLLQYQRKDNVRRWFNTVIGEAFNDSNARISEEDLTAIMTPRQVEPGEMQQGDLFLGCDVGQTCHVIIGRPNALLEFHQVPQQEIVEFVRGRVESLGIVKGGIDYYPYTPTAEAIRDATNGVIMPMAYSTSKTAPPIKETTDEFETVTHYTINRTQALDLVAKQCRNRSWQVAGYGPFGSLVKTHFRDMIRIEAPDEPPVWNKINGDDHFLHAAALHQTAVRLQAGLDFNTDVRQSVVLLPGSRLFQPQGKPIFRGADQAGVLR
ncbi:phage terminase large subunit family protein [Methylorubrum suomiense]|uniref:Phage terminase large subunit GpA ATPase domain-containing protein n=1 Tax=Methylorubrum suomiense TaxID=144191 RepID=A0ABQ4V0F1_9HYPH|nr:phage terminase large subunit family protein [Methylorubrum suomiense]GJE78076.1 hypothetical protein BGCPKDLD_4687 [Methylorubrum suomiense]